MTPLSPLFRRLAYVVELELPNRKAHAQQVIKEFVDGIVEMNRLI